MNNNFTAQVNHEKQTVLRRHLARVIGAASSRSVRNCNTDRNVINSLLRHNDSIFGNQCHLAQVSVIVTTTGYNGHNHNRISTIVPLYQLAVALRVVLEIP